MTDADDEFLRELLEAFASEAAEHVESLSTGLLELEKLPNAETQAEIVETIYRNAHSLKGASRAVDLIDIEQTCQALEYALAGLKRGDLRLSASLFDVLHAAVDMIGGMLKAGGGDGEPPDPMALVQMQKQLVSLITAPAEVGREDSDRKVHDRLAAAAPADVKPGPVVPEPPPQRRDSGPPGPSDSAADAAPSAEPSPAPVDEDAPARAAAETIRVSVAKLDAILRQSEEMLSVKQAAARSREDTAALLDGFSEWRQRWSGLQRAITGRRRQSAAARANGDHGSRGGDYDHLFEFLEWNAECVRSLEGRIRDVVTTAGREERATGMLVDQLLDECRHVVMLPFSSVLAMMPKMVRDLSRDLGKEVDLELPAADVIVDKRVLEEMKDAFIHLIRNAVDHGVEPPAERERKGKPSRGRIRVAVRHVSGNKVEVTIADDGGGIDVDAVKRKAVALGRVSADELDHLADEDIHHLVFHTELSTKPIITDISGRGLGLAIVQERVEKLNGSLAVASDGSTGTEFTIVLPLSLATFRGVRVRACGRDFVVPAVNVDAVDRVRTAAIDTVEGRRTVSLGSGGLLALESLAHVLQLPSQPGAGDASDHVLVLILRSADARIAFEVDEVLEEHEVLVKGLGPQLARVRNVAGATVLAAGQVVPILNASDLIRSAIKSPGSAMVDPVAPTAVTADRHAHKILVCDDSITSRSLLANILAGAGYDVTTAVDGLEAWTELCVGSYNMVVSDVEMPRMTGFELTERIRADRRFEELPVALVTGLASKEDREKGIDVGANAYIVKSGFDQSKLLDVIRRFV